MHATSKFSAPRDRAVQGVYRDRGFHPGVNRIADDIVAEHVPDRANVRIAFKRTMFGDGGQPQFVRRGCG